MVIPEKKVKFNPVFPVTTLKRGGFITLGVAYSCNLFLEMDYSTKC